MRITSFYAALFAFFFIALSVRAIGARRRARVALGAGDDAMLLRASRVHANFAEYVPFALLLVAFAEAGGAPAWFVHAACLVLAAGRVAHAFGVGRSVEDFRYRVFGMSCTLGVIGVAALASLATSLRG